MIPIGAYHGIAWSVVEVGDQGLLVMLWDSQRLHIIVTWRVPLLRSHAIAHSAFTGLLFRSSKWSYVISTWVWNSITFIQLRVVKRYSRRECKGREGRQFISMLPWNRSLHLHNRFTKNLRKYSILKIKNGASDYFVWQCVFTICTCI